MAPDPDLREFLFRSTLACLPPRKRLLKESISLLSTKFFFGVGKAWFGGEERERERVKFLGGGTYVFALVAREV